MRKTSAIRFLTRVLAASAAVYALYTTFTWVRYGRVKSVTPEDVDSLLDRFMPFYEVAERHQLRVAAPAAITFAAAADLDLQQSPAIRAIFKGREWILGSNPATAPPPQPLLIWAKAMGWSLLAEIPGREVVMGAVTRPWEANVVFRPLPPEKFAAFDEPGYVKIAWTLRADPVTLTESIALSETRVTTTDITARRKFRQYWVFLSPGIILIRKIALRMVKRDAESRAAISRS